MSHSPDVDCPCGSCHKPGTIFWFPLTEEQFGEIRTGKWVEAHFHDVTFLNGRMTVIAGYEWTLPSPASKAGRELLKLGSVQPVKLTDAELDRMEREGSGCGGPLGDGRYQLMIVSKKWMDKEGLKQ